MLKYHLSFYPEKVESEKLSYIQNRSLRDGGQEDLVLLQRSQVHFSEP